MQEVSWAVTFVEWDPDTGAIVTVRWKVTASDGQDTAECLGTCKFSAVPDSDSFIPLDTVDESVVLDWVKKKTPNYKRTEERALTRLAALKVKDTIRGVPWDGIEIPKKVPKVY